MAAWSSCKQLVKVITAAADRGRASAEAGVLAGVTNGQASDCLMCASVCAGVCVWRVTNYRQLKRN